MWTTTLKIGIIATPSAWDACQASHPFPQHNKPTLSWNSDLSLYPNINMDILHTVLCSKGADEENFSNNQ